MIYTQNNILEKTNYYQERIKREKSKRLRGRIQYTIARCKSGMVLYHFAKVSEINKTGSKVNFILLQT